MPDSSGAQEIIGVETGQESRRPRFGFLRRGGHLAIESAQVVPAVEISGASDTLLGLEDQLAEYQGLWNDHRAVSQAALSDETTKTLFQEVLGQYEERSLIPTWEKRRALQKLIQTGYGRFISVYIGMGRVKHSITAQYRGEHSLVPASPGSSMVEASAFSKLTSKKGALLSPDNLGAKQPNIVELMKKMDAVEVAASRTYKPISRLEVQMSKRIYETVGDDSSKALMLVESFTSCAESEAGIEKTFARFLANRFQAFGDRSELGSALSLVEHHAALGAFAQNFIAQKLTEHEGDNILAYFARRLSESEGAFEADMAARFEDWPAEYREEYASYATTRLKQLTVQVAKTAERSQYPDWALPDSDMLEDEIDQLIHTLSLRYDNKKMYVHKARPSSRKAGNRAGSVNVADQFESVERVSEPRKVNMVVRGKDGFVSRNGLTTQEVIIAKIGNTHKDNKVFLAELETAMAVLQKDPFDDNGVRSVSDGPGTKSISIDGKTMRVYRASLARMSGIPTSRQSKELRIVFTANRQELNILGVFTQHGEYVRFLGSL